MDRRRATGAGRENPPAGPASAFPSTVWTEIREAGDTHHPRHRERLEDFIRRYWNPVFVYIRLTWRKPVEDSQDLTQAFFTKLLQRRLLGRVHAGGSSFRTYLKVVLRNFLIDTTRRETARGPGKPVHRLPTEDAGPIDTTRPAEGAPEEAFDRQWFHDLTERALGDLQEELRRQRKSAYFEVFRRYCLVTGGETPPDSRPTYADVAKEMRLSESDVRNRLRYCRSMLRDRLRARIRDYVSGEENVERELRSVLKS